MHVNTLKEGMGPSRFELESEDPQSPRMPGYPMAPSPYYFLTSGICTYPFYSVLIDMVFQSREFNLV